MNIETKIIEQAKKHGWTIIFGEPSVSDYLLGVWNLNGDLKYYNRVHHKDPIPKEVIDILLKECILKDNMNNNDKIKLDGSYIPRSSPLPPPHPSLCRKLDKHVPPLYEYKNKLKEDIAKEDIEVKLHNTTDAQVWTDEFIKTLNSVFPEIFNDPNYLVPKRRYDDFKEWVFGWFCNAIQTGIDLTNNERDKQYIYILQSNSGDIVDIYNYEPSEQDINSSYKLRFNFPKETPVDASKKCHLIRYNKYKGMQIWNGKAEPDTKYNWKDL